MFATRKTALALAALTLSLAGVPAAMAKGYPQPISVEVQDYVATAHVSWNPEHQSGAVRDLSIPDGYVPLDTANQFGTDCFPSRRRDELCDWGCEDRTSREYDPQ